MTSWDKVEKRKSPISFTKQDEIMEYLKIAVCVFIAGVYCYFMIWG